MTQLVRRSRVAYQRLVSSWLWRPRTIEDRNVRLLYLNTASIGVPSAGIVAFMPVFLARLGASANMIGWLTSAPALIAMIALLPGAILAERNRDQVRVRCASIRAQRLVYLLCALMPLVIPTRFLVVPLIVAWGIKTIPESISSPAWTAVLSRSMSPRRRPRVNGMRWALLSIVSAIASAFFGWLLDRVAFPWNYQIVFLISFAFGWLDPYFFSRIEVPDVDRLAASSRRLVERMVDYVRPVLAHRAFLLIMALMIPYRLALNLPAPLLSLYWVNELQATDSLIGIRGTVAHAALVVGYMFWGRSAERLSSRWQLAAPALGLALYPIVTGLVRTPAGIVPVAAIWGLTVSGIDVGLFEIMLGAMPQARQALFAAVWGVVANAAAFAGPLIGAALGRNLGLSTALVLSGLAQIACVALFAALPTPAASGDEQV